MGLAGVELVLSIEEHFGVQIPHARTAALKTVGDLAAMVHERLQSVRDPRAASQIFDEVRTIVARHACTSEDEIEHDTQFVDDLNLR